MDYFGEFVFFSFVLMRMSGFIMLNPIFGRNNVPALIRGGFTIVLAVIVFLATPAQEIPLSGMLEYGLLLLQEFAVGYALGFVISLFLFVIILAGELIDMQLGISMSKVYDAQSNTSIALSATYYNAIFMLLFFAVDGHLALLHTMLNSGSVIPYGQVTLGRELAMAVLDTVTVCSNLGVKMAFPFIAIEVLCTMGMGILMRAIPQINVFVVNIQLKIFMGLMVIIVLFSPMSDFLNDLIVQMIDSVRNIMTFMI